MNKNMFAFNLCCFAPHKNFNNKGVLEFLSTLSFFKTRKYKKTKILIFIFALSFILNPFFAFSQRDTLDYGKYKAISDKNYYYIIDTTTNEILIKSGKYSHLQIEYDEKLILAHKNGNEGYIDINEKEIIPLKYNDVGVFACNLIIAKRNGLYGYINKNNKVIIDFQFSKGSYFHEPGIAVVKKKSNRKFGVIDTLGREVLPFIYDEIKHIDTILIANKNKKWAFFNPNGKQLTPSIFDEVVLSSMKYYTNFGLGYINKVYFNHNAVVVKKDNRYSFLDTKFEEIFPFGYFDEIKPLNYYGISVVRKGNKYGILNINNLNDIQFYDSIYLNRRYIDEPIYYYYVKRDNKIILLDTLANNSLNILFDSIRFLELNYSIAYADSSVYLINNIGNIITSEYKELRANDYNSRFLVARKDKDFGLIDYYNKEIISFNYQDIEYNQFTKLSFAKRNNKWGLIDEKEQVLIPHLYEFIMNACCYDRDEKTAYIVNLNGKFGTIDIDNNIIIPIEYDKISSWVEYGPNAHFVKKDGKLGMISHSGKILLPTIYSSIYYLNDSILQVEIHDSVGFVTINNRIIIPIIYEGGYCDIKNDIFFYTPKQEKICMLSKGEWCCFNIKGKRINAKMTKKELKKYYKNQKEIEDYNKECIDKNIKIWTIEDEYFFEIDTK